VANIEAADAEKSTPATIPTPARTTTFRRIGLRISARHRDENQHCHAGEKKIAEAAVALLADYPGCDGPS
jgi:hypothetical protein